MCVLWQECEEELTQKAALVSRLHEKTSQIGNLLTNLQKQNEKASSPTDSYIPKIPPFRGTPSDKTGPKNTFSNGTLKSKNVPLTSNLTKGKFYSPPDKNSLLLTSKSVVKEQLLTFDSCSSENNSAQSEIFSEKDKSGTQLLNDKESRPSGINASDQ